MSRNAKSCRWGKKDSLVGEKGSCIRDSQEVDVLYKQSTSTGSVMIVGVPFCQ